MKKDKPWILQATMQGQKQSIPKGKDLLKDKAKRNENR